ncbi:MAG: hypothetical protein ACLF0G_15570, partial [Candidatus Brocadiia bacterium]
ALALAMGLGGAVWAGEEAPWPAPVAGFEAPEGGEHPRLFFRRGDLAALRARAKTPEGQALVRRLEAQLGGGQSIPEPTNPMTSAYGKQGGPKPQKKELPLGTYSISHAAGFGFLYLLTGEKSYAELGKECFELAFRGVRDRDREARYSWKRPGGALRAGPSLGWYAVGYDLCYDGWDEATRRKIALAIQNYDEGKHMSLPELARGSRHMPASNHWGMQVGGAALALLAIRDDPGVDKAKIEKLLDQNARAMVRNLTEGFGDHGWFPEGDGTGSMSSQIAFIPALQAWRVAGGKAFITPRPNAPWMTLKWIFLTVPRDGRMDFPSRGAYPHNVWDRDGISGAGYFAEGFGGVRPDQRPALLWFYNHHLRAIDESNGTPFDTPSPYPHHTILAFVNWPFGLAERNPAECIPRAVMDQKWGFFMCRNRWRDEKDTVISIQTLSTRGWHKARSRARLWVWALGEKTKWGRLPGKVAYFQPAADGSAILTGGDGTCLAIDFSGASGAEAMLVMTGPGAPRNNLVEAGGVSYSFKFLTAGDPPTPRADGDRVVVGDQTVATADGHLVLGTMAEPWKPR